MPIRRFKILHRGLLSGSRNLHRYTPVAHTNARLSRTHFSLNLCRLTQDDKGWADSTIPTNVRKFTQQTIRSSEDRTAPTIKSRRFINRLERFIESDQAVLGVDKQVLFPVNNYQNAKKFVNLLREARSRTGVDLIHELAIHQGRWEAALSLVESLISHCRTDEQGHKAILSVRQPFEEDGPFSQAQATKKSHIALPISNDDKEKKKSGVSNHDHESSFVVPLKTKILGELWQSMASMILSAQDMGTESPDYAAIMSIVLDIMAQLHHQDLLPSTLYNYQLTNKDGPLWRPPAIHMLSSRIMTVLSDVAWKKHWLQEMAKAKEQGYELEPARLQPQLPLVGPEIWLELVLWACVEEGWISQAAWIISQIVARSHDPARRWTVKAWEELDPASKPQPAWFDVLKSQLQRSRINQFTGIAIANSGTAIVELGPRTLSREVVHVICDGVLNIQHRAAPCTLSSLEAWKQARLVDCRALLQENVAKYSQEILDVSYTRQIEGANAYPTAYADASYYVTNAKRADRTINTPLDNVRTSCDTVSAKIGILHESLFTFSQQENYWACLQSLQNIRILVPRHGGVASPVLEADNGEPSVATASAAQSDDGVTKRMLPSHALNSVLEFAMNNYFLVLAKQIFDGEFLPSSFDKDIHLQPTLFRYAHMIEDKDMLRHLITQVKGPVSGSMLHAMLGTQVQEGKWDTVKTILRHLQMYPEEGWNIHDASVIAASLMSHEVKNAQNKSSYVAMNRILQDLLNGAYDPPPKASQVPDRRFFQQAYQFARILSTLPLQSLRDIGAHHLQSHDKQMCITIPANSFRPLLHAIVRHHGPQVGKRIWQRWCTKVSWGEDLPRQGITIDIDGIEKVIVPSLGLLRTIIRPIMLTMRNVKSNHAAQSLPARTSAERLIEANTSNVTPLMRSVVNWAVPVFREFGMTDLAIKREFVGSKKALRGHVGPYPVR